jgi:multicomponent Na+:H+ antiporter subunit G
VIDLFEIVGFVLVILGAVLNVIGSIGLNRFPNYFVRIHASTVSVMGGCFVPLVGVAILAFGSSDLATALGAIATGIFIFLTAPVSSHAVARAAAKSRIDRGPLCCDHLEEDKK